MDNKNSLTTQATSASTTEAHKGNLYKKRIASTELFRGERELIIEHGSDEYRLRLTNQGKLILTK